MHAMQWTNNNTIVHVGKVAGFRMLPMHELELVQRLQWGVEHPIDASDSSTEKTLATRELLESQMATELFQVLLRVSSGPRLECTAYSVIFYYSLYMR
jgi:hypothetical protein